MTDRVMPLCHSNEYIQPPILKVHIILEFLGARILPCVRLDLVHHSLDVRNLFDRVVLFYQIC